MLRANIKRSRGTKKHYAHFSEIKNKGLVEFFRATGLRYCGTMKSDELKSIVKEMKKEQVLQKHPYQITPPFIESGRWMTYILDTEVNKRVKRTFYTEDGIYQKLILLLLEPT